VNQESLPTQGHQSIDFLLDPTARFQADGEWAPDPVGRRSDEPERLADPVLKDPAGLLGSQIAALEPTRSLGGVELREQGLPSREQLRVIRGSPLADDFGDEFVVHGRLRTPRDWIRPPPAARPLRWVGKRGG